MAATLLDFAVANDAAAATTIINQWNAEETADGVINTVVHRATASFSGEVAREMQAAARIGVFVDGHEDFVFDVFNAARIPESAAG